MNVDSHSLDQESSIRYPGWGVLAAAFTGVMVSFSPIVPYTFSLFLDPLHESFGWKREAMGGAFALAAITVAFVSPLIGILLDRFPPRRIILPGILVFAAMRDRRIADKLFPEKRIRYLFDERIELCVLTEELANRHRSTQADLTGLIPSRKLERFWLTDDTSENMSVLH